MPIDIRNINEITFTQSFRGYNTEEVDDFLDDIYDESVKNNKEIEELKKRITELESGVLAAPLEHDGGASQEEAYAIIANAQQEADNLMDAARKKAHALIESAEKMAAQKLNSNASVMEAAPMAVSSDTLDKLKTVLSESYKKQMQILSGVAAIPNAQPSIPAENEPQPEDKAPNAPKDDVPSVSFSGITREHRPHIPAERDILSEINSIGLDAYKPPVQRQEEAPERPTIELKEPEYEPIEEETGGLAFSFGDHDDPEEDTKPFAPVDARPEEPKMPEPQPEDPDDIIAQILRDNNRN